MLGALICGMTVVSAILWVLEPKPRVPGTEVILTSMSPQEDQNKLFNSLDSLDTRRWSAIVVDPSGMMEGSAETVGLMHERLGLGGLAYHFVINNGHGQPDGDVQFGKRWFQQADGAYSTGANGEWYNRNAIGVCLIGDPSKKAPTAAQMRELVWLVQQLQMRFNIPANQVFVQGGIENPRDPGLFPVASFRQQLVNASSR
ncbi:MAG: peptidoglycan recognition family protein [Planctomycetota bacterium]|nr:peptidoglycan recognition family protein [Planctomycetota bacterium]